MERGGRAARGDRVEGEEREPGCRRREWMVLCSYPDMDARGTVMEMLCVWGGVCVHVWCENTKAFEGARHLLAPYNHPAR